MILVLVNGSQGSLESLRDARLVDDVKALVIDYGQPDRMELNRAIEAAGDDLIFVQLRMPETGDFWNRFSRLRLIGAIAQFYYNALKADEVTWGEERQTIQMGCG